MARSILLFVLLLIAATACRFSEEARGSKGTFIIEESSRPYTWDTDSVPSEFFKFVDRVEALSDSLAKKVVVDSFFNSVMQQGIPYVEENILAHFIYYDSTFSNVRVQITADFNQWDYDHINFIHLPKTNFYYYSRIFEPEARIEYEIVVNGIKARDPYNARRYGNAADAHSELRMPLYPPPAETESYNIPHGMVTSLQWAPDYNAPQRLLRIYLPPGYDKDKKYPVVYLHDGSLWYSNGHATNTLDYLIYHDLIRPIIAVFVDPISRQYEYLYNDEFAAMFADKLVSYVDANYSTDPRRHSRAIAGFSHGGTTALFMTLQHADVFGNCAAYSPSLHTGDLVEQYRQHSNLRLKMYLDAGYYEDWIYQPTLQLAHNLEEKNYDGRFYGWPEYHSLGSWTAHLDNALIYFFPAD